MNTNFLKNFLKLRVFSILTVTTIIFAAFLTAGAILILALLGPTTFIESERVISQSIPTEIVSTYGKQGIGVPLPVPSEEVNALVRDGWSLDLPDNIEHPARCRHKVVVNGVTLKWHHSHTQIFESLKGACSVWGAGPTGNIYMSLPDSADRIESITIQWHLAGKSGVISTPQEDQQRNLLGLIGISLCCIGSIGLAISASLFRKNWATWLLAVAAGSAAGLTTGCGLLVSTDTAVGEWLSSFLSMGVLLICMSTLTLGIVLAIAARWLRPLDNVKPPSLAIVILTLGVSSASLASGWVSSQLATGAFSSESITSMLFAGRIPFSDGAGWYQGMQAVNKGQPVRWAARRPVHAVIRSGELEIAGGNYQWGLLLQMAVSSLAISALAISAWSALTPSVALIVWVGAFRVGQEFLGSFLSESVGYSCACLSLAYLLAGCKDNRFGVRLAGIAWLGMAWLVRPGPFGLLVVPIIVEIVIPLVGRLRRITIATLVMASVLIGGKAVYFLVASDDAVENENAACVIYGLAIGEPYDVALKVFASEAPPGRMTLPEQNSLMYHQALEKFISNPSRAVTRAMERLQQGFNSSVIELPGSVVAPFVKLITPWRLPINAIGWTILICSTLTAFVMIKRGSNVGLMLAGSVIGLITSLSVTWSNGNLRVIIIAMPFLVTFLALTFTIAQSTIDLYKCKDNSRQTVQVAHLAAGLILTTFIVGVVAFTLRRSSITTPATTSMTVSINVDPAVFIVDENGSANLFGAAVLTRADALRSIRERFGSRDQLDEFVEKLKSDSLIVTTPSFKMLVIENAGRPQSGNLIVEAMENTSNENILRATAWHWIGQ